MAKNKDDLRTTIKFENRLLWKAKKIHREQTGDHRVWVGGNFVQCDTCGFHAHTTGHGYLQQHNEDYSVNEKIV